MEVGFRVGAVPLVGAGVVELAVVIIRAVAGLEEDVVSVPPSALRRSPELLPTS